MYIVYTLYMHVHVHEHDMQVANGVHAYKMYNTTRVLCTDVYTCFHGQLTTVYTILLFDKHILHVYIMYMYTCIQKHTTDHEVSHTHSLCNRHILYTCI